MTGCEIRCACVSDETRPPRRVGACPFLASTFFFFLFGAENDRHDNDGYERPFFSPRDSWKRLEEKRRGEERRGEERRD